MNVGVLAPLSVRVAREPLLRFGRAVEELGYDSIWMSEHILVPMHVESRYPYSPDGTFFWEHTAPWLQGMVALGFLAGVTERVRLGTSVIPIITRDPLSLAKEAATVDVLSGGRLDLGLGAGWCHEEAAVLGHASDHPLGRLEETVDILRLAWGEESFDYHGRFYDFPAVAVHPQPVQGAGLPIWIGGSSPRLVKLTAEKADGNVISQRVDRLPAIRAAIPAHKLISVSLFLADGYDAGAIRAEAQALREQGADGFRLNLRGVDAESTMSLVERFAEDVLPSIR